MILQSEISNEGMVLIMEKLHTTVSTPIELECPKSDEPTAMINSFAPKVGQAYFSHCT